MSGEPRVEHKPYSFHLEFFVFGKGGLEQVPPLIRGHGREEGLLVDRICNKTESSTQGKPEGQGGRQGGRSEASRKSETCVGVRLAILLAVGLYVRSGQRDARKDVSHTIR
jgi:hypothetical protein